MKVRKIGKRWRSRSYTLSAWVKNPSDDDWRLMHRIVGCMGRPSATLRLVAPEIQ